MHEESIKIAAVGDIMLGDRPLMVGLGVRSNIEGSNSYDPFSQIGEYLKSFDIVSVSYTHLTLPTIYSV